MTQRQNTSRVLAVIFLGVLFGVYKHAMQIRWAERGRQAFLTDQSRQFDRGMLPPHSLLVTIAAGILLSAIAYGLYEFLAAGIARVLPADASQE